MRRSDPLVARQEEVALGVDRRNDMNRVWQAMRRCLSQVGRLDEDFSRYGPQIHEATPDKQIEIQATLHL
nr:hypothetical protein [Methylocystis iwaonis]